MYICSPPRPPEWLPLPAVCSLVETHGISRPSLQPSSCHLHQSEGTKCVRGDKSRVIVHNRTKAVLFDFTQKCIHLLHSLQSIVLFIKIKRFKTISTRTPASVHLFNQAINSSFQNQQRHFFYYTYQIFAQNQLRGNQIHGERE